MKKLILLMLVTGFSLSIFSQNVAILPARIIGNDTIPVYNYKTINIVSKRTFDNSRAKYEYYLLRSRIVKVYPYAKQAADLINEVERNLATMDKKREKKKYLKKMEKELKEKFTDQLKNLSVSQGKILMKLIERETDQSCYDIIKMYKNGFSAFYWQKLAQLYGSDLRMQYDPQQERDMEAIVSAIEGNY